MKNENDICRKALILIARTHKWDDVTLKLTTNMNYVLSFIKDNGDCTYPTIKNYCVIASRETHNKYELILDQLLQNKDICKCGIGDRPLNLNYPHVFFHDKIFSGTLTNITREELLIRAELEDI